MKFGKHKSICLYLVLSILFLTACEPKTVGKETADSKQVLNEIETEQHEISMSDGENTDADQKKSLNWKAIQVPVNFDWRKNHNEIQFMTWESANQTIEDLHAISQSEYDSTVEQLSYSEDYFETKSLVVFYYDVAVGCEICVQDVQYSDDGVNVIVEYRTPPIGTVQCAAFHSCCIFLEIDETIPSSAHVTLETVLGEKSCES